MRPTFLRLILADLFLSFGPGWMSAIYLFYFTDCRGFTTGQASILLATYILAGIIGAPAIARIAIRLSKHRTVMMLNEDAMVTGIAMHTAIATTWLDRAAAQVTRPA